MNCLRTFAEVIFATEPSTVKITNAALTTPRAAEKLCQVQNYLIDKYHYGLLIYDAYHPKRAVRDFVNWSEQPPSGEAELIRKAKHYPSLNLSFLN
ncbi:MAG: D-alanyl-D-alanine dipeptidase [Gammaproteobacteria bacterium]|jgi:D-alanyl-D-alanine dipeptidase|nr:D-alanyl-D-alanine dipeptidase [Gammaproteobacteria bacterium]